MLLKKTVTLSTTSFLILSAVCDTLFGLFLGKMVTAISLLNFEIFKIAFIKLTLSMILSYLFDFLGWTGAIYLSCNCIETIKNSLYETELSKKKICELDISSFTTKADLVYSDYFMARWRIVRHLSSLIAAIIGVISINPLMFLVALIAGFLPLIVPRLFKNKLQDSTSLYTHENNSYIKFINDTLLGRKEIIKYGVKTAYFNKHATVNALVEKKRQLSKTYNKLANIVSEMLGAFSSISVFTIGGYLTFSGYLEVGSILGVTQLMNYIINPVIQIVSERNYIMSATPVLKDLLFKDHIFPPISIENNSKKALSPYGLIAERITWSYDFKTDYVLKGFSYKFESGKKYLIQGKSGIGKTTLAKILCGEIVPQAGTVYLDGIPIQNFDDTNKYNKIRMIDQESYMFNDTLFENINLYRSYNEKDIIPILNSLGISKNLKENVSNDEGLSGGQKARISLARELLSPSKIIIVDEPTAGLDKGTARALIDYLCSIQTTLIVISHTEDNIIKEQFDEIISL